MRLRNKLSLLAGSSILIIAPCLVKPAVAADDDHALTNIADEGMEDGYQSAGSSSSAGTSYAGIGYGDQLLTDPITLSKVPNFDFGYHKRTEGKSKFQLIDSTGDKRSLIVKDKNGHLNWAVTASLGENNVKPSQIKSRDVSIGLYENRLDGAVLKLATLEEGSRYIDAESSAIDGISIFDIGAEISSAGTSKVILQRTLDDPRRTNHNDRLAVMVTFYNRGSAYLNLDLDNQPYTADKYVAPITWTLNVTN